MRFKPNELKRRKIHFHIKQSTWRSSGTKVPPIIVNQIYFHAKHYQKYLSQNSLLNEIEHYFALVNATF